MATNGYRVLFVGNVLKDGHTEYQIKVIDSSETSWFIHKRYREIRELHDQMKLRYPEQLSWFPPKRFFGNTDMKFIDERQKELQRYMQHLLFFEPQCNARVLRMFLEIPYKNKSSAEKCLPPAIEDTTEDLLQSLKVHLLDLSQPCEEFLETRDLACRLDLYSSILYGHRSKPTGKETEWRRETDGGGSQPGDREADELWTDTQKEGLLWRPTDPLIREKLRLGQRKVVWKDLADQWETTILAPTLPVTDCSWPLMYKRLYQISAINDPGRPIHGVRTLRAEFPSGSSSSSSSEAEPPSARQDFAEPDEVVVERSVDDVASQSERTSGRAASVNSPVKEAHYK